MVSGASIQGMPSAVGWKRDQVQPGEGFLSSLSSSLQSLLSSFASDISFRVFYDAFKSILSETLPPQDSQDPCKEAVASYVKPLWA